ncbi:unnamed protein product [Closterium sp. NIES-64]|nr:unnamed protein product [Closterium sp. NIES-64]CAI6004446.1 unnamed protein product [Closterium sp. NIES-65]
MATKSHPNLVRLLGYCFDMSYEAERMEQIVVYEFMANGDLGRWIGAGAPHPLTMQQRLAILTGMARGLEYLHGFSIVHRDIKPANVLLDARMHAKLADFGLVRLGEGTSVAATRVMGTPGYVDPAYYHSHKATPKADVHSFGVVMLAVITARKAIYNIDSNQVNLKQWAAALVAAGDVAALKDPHLQAPDDLVLRMACLALTCTAMPTASRPGMSRVLAELLLLKEEFFGEEEDRMAIRIDHEIESSEQVDFTLELARLQGIQHVSPRPRTNDFRRKINEMATKSHPNLVRLLGYCFDMSYEAERMEQIVVYEFMANGDLDRWIGAGAPHPLTMQQRLSILTGMARGLEYLHGFSIVHRDIKPANVLLDARMHAKLADFGLVRLGEGTSVAATRVMGTPGYVDPAYYRSHKATPKADVHRCG